MTYSQNAAMPPLMPGDQTYQPNTNIIVAQLNPRRYRITFVNDSGVTIYIMKGGGAAANVGLRLNAFGGSYTEEMHMHNGMGAIYTGIWTAYSGSAGNNLLVSEDSL